MAIVLTCNSVFAFVLSTTLLAVSLSALSLVNADISGFTVELIHRDSPNSPLFNPSETPCQHLTHSLQCSIRRANQFNQVLTSPSTAQSTLSFGDGDYFMKLSIGTPPVEIFAAADTASNVIWAQCKSCTICNKQNAPVFDPNASLTYKRVPCNSSLCKSLIIHSCQSNICQYSCPFGYGMSVGILAMDTSHLVFHHWPICFPS